MSYDFAVIPADLITSPEQAARLHVAMCEEVQRPAPRDVEEFVAELHRKYGFENDEALSTWLGLSGIGACRGSVGWVSVVWVRLRQSVR